MISSIGISVSGLHAASTRMAASADNVANLQTRSIKKGGEVVQKAYTPHDVQQSSIEPQGGVRATVRDRDPATVQLPTPDGEVADYPNVNLEEEIVGQEVASYDFKANLKAIKAADDMTKSLLDITS